jgi:hypothetical protein
LTDEAAKIAGSIQIEEKVVLLHTVALKREGSNTREVTKTGEKKINKGSKIRARQTYASEPIEQPPIKIMSRLNYGPAFYH